MCYMSEEAPGPDKVGVRELRQNLSVYLDRVKGGETLEVTEHGRAVALLTPLPRVPQSTLDRLITEGRVTPGTGDLLAYLRTNRPRTHHATAEPLTTPSEPEPTMTQILRRMQDEGPH